MPRVAQPARAPRKASGESNSPHKLVLNDDRQEKAARLQSRQALHDLHVNSIRAAASPMRKLSGAQNQPASASPQTPHQVPGKRRDGGAGSAGGRRLSSLLGGGSSMTPVKRVPILADFEEWMKMATDNKINATNSWNFALIDYFHDMSLLKEGDGVNFQKASCTLDGCVKIYTSRVDSVASETGKLLSGLADSGSKGATQATTDDGAEDSEGDEDNGETQQKTRKRTTRSSEATLASSFAALQLKKFDLEFAVDPLFKKASADFDEGGARGLLLNHLAINEQGRLAFDSSDDAAEANSSAETSIPDQPTSDDPHIPPAQHVQATDLDGVISALGMQYFPDLETLDTFDICPSLKNFDLCDVSASLDIGALKNAQQSHSPDLHNATPPPTPNLNVHNPGPVDAMEDDDGMQGDFEMPADVGFGEGGDIWMRAAPLESRSCQDRVGLRDGPLGLEDEPLDSVESDTTPLGFDVRLASRLQPENAEIWKMLDGSTGQNWAGPQYWKIQKVKDGTKATTNVVRRKEKEPFQIDFTSALEPQTADLILMGAATASALLLPKAQQRSRTRNLLPDDKHFSARQLLHLFLKPRARVSLRRRVGDDFKISRDMNDNPDEQYWARQQLDSAAVTGSSEDVKGAYDANFFQDDGPGFANDLGDDEANAFADAREAFTPETGLLGEADGVSAGNAPESDTRAGPFGNQLVTQSRRMRPEYVQYARAATKVDVRRLKEEIWRGIGMSKLPEAPATPPPEQPAPEPPSTTSTDSGLKFTSIIKGLGAAYPADAMADISTSYCFICLLHLANEKGLSLQHETGLQELDIWQDRIVADVESV